MSARPVPDDGRPLVVADHPEIVDDLLRLAAAAAVEVELVPDAVAARRSWGSAPIVLVGAELAAAVASAGLPRRPCVVLVGGADVTAEQEEVWRLATEVGAEHVVFLPAAEPWLVDRLADAAAGPGTRRGTVVGVVGGRGGAGASVLAAALAVTAVRFGLRTMLVDADPYGGGLDLVLGGEEAEGLRWPELAGASGRLSGTALHGSLPRIGELCVLSWDRRNAGDVSPAALEAVLAAGRATSDVVVVDLPRRPDEATVHVLQVASRVLLVVPAEVRACAAAARVAHAVSAHCGDLRVVVRGPAPARLRSRDVVAALGLPLEGVMRPEPGLAAALERGVAPGGDPRGPLASLCRRVLVSLDLLPDGSAVA